jgi:long-chain fatty acid transport protein
MLLLLAAQAHASAYYFLDSGARAIGRGGAWIVGGDDLSAQYYNPAELSNIKRPMLNVQGWAVAQNIQFDRADEDGQDPYENVHNESPPIYEPEFGYAAPLGGISPILKNTTLAVGLYVPTSPYLAFPEDGPQRYSLIDSLIWQVYAGPSVAQKITPWLTVGAGLQYTFLRVEERLAATICTLPDAEDCANADSRQYEDPANDIVLGVKTWDPFELSWNAGFILKPTPRVEIGAAFQPPIKYTAPGSISATFNENYSLANQLDGLSFTDDDVTLKVTIPMIVRAGVQVTPIDPLRVELAGTWTNWAVMKELRITDMDLTVKHADDATLLQDDIVVTDDVVFPTGYQNSWSARLGGDYQLNEWAQVRAGAHYESSAVPDANLAVNLVDGPKWGVGAGATFTVAKRVAFDVAFAEQFMGSREITNSKVTQQALLTELSPPYASTVVPGKVIGNGKMTSNVTFVAVGATLYFGASEPKPN